MFILLQVGVKGACKNFNRGLDCDVLVAEVGEEFIVKSQNTENMDNLKNFTPA